MTPIRRHEAHLYANNANRAKNISVGDIPEGILVRLFEVSGEELVCRVDGTRGMAARLSPVTRRTDSAP